MELNLHKNTLKDIERWLNAKVSHSSGSNSSQGGGSNSLEESKFA
jgi:hypothetical protein